MRRIRYAIVHRYASWLLNTDTGKFMFEDELKIESESKIRGLAACLRLIRPTSQYTQFCSYKVNPEGKLLHFAFDIPMEFVNMPSNQRQFSVRQRDIEALRRYALPFLDAMNGEFWKFRMAVQMHDLAHFQNLEWKVRYFLWSAALEALYTSQGGQNMGSLVAKERIKFLLDPTTLIYQTGELFSLIPQVTTTVADVVDELYCLRNHIAHGDKLPDYYYALEGRPDFDGNLSRAESHLEEISSLVRQSILAILDKGLLTHFKDSASSEAFFGARGLTKKELRAALGPLAHFACPT